MSAQKIELNDQDEVMDSAAAEEDEDEVEEDGDEGGEDEMIEEDGEEELEEMKEDGSKDINEEDDEEDRKELLKRKKSLSKIKLARQVSVASQGRGIMAAHQPVIGDDGLDGMRTR